MGVALLWQVALAYAAPPSPTYQVRYKPGSCSPSRSEQKRVRWLQGQLEAQAAAMQEAQALLSQAHVELEGARANDRQSQRLVQQQSEQIGALRRQLDALRAQPRSAPPERAEHVEWEQKLQASHLECCKAQEEVLKEKKAHKEHVASLRLQLAALNASLGSQQCECTRKIAALQDELAAHRAKVAELERKAAQGSAPPELQGCCELEKPALWESRTGGGSARADEVHHRATEQDHL